MDVRIGIVSSINYENGSVRVSFTDKDNMVSKELPLLSFEYNPPSVGNSVLCVFYTMGRGICLGKFFNQNNTPSSYGGDIFRKDLGIDSFLEYNKTLKTLTISAENIILDGDITITGDLQVDGNINATGTINASNYPP